MVGKLIRAIERGEELEWRGGYGLFKMLWRTLERQARERGYEVAGEWIGPEWVAGRERVVHQVRIFKGDELVAVLEYTHEKSFYTGVCGNHREGVIALIPLKSEDEKCLRDEELKEEVRRLKEIADELYSVARVKALELKREGMAREGLRLAWAASDIAHACDAVDYALSVSLQHFREMLEDLEERVGHHSPLLVWAGGDAVEKLRSQIRKLKKLCGVR